MTWDELDFENMKLEANYVSPKQASSEALNKIKTMQSNHVNTKKTLFQKISRVFVF